MTTRLSLADWSGILPKERRSKMAAYYRQKEVMSYAHELWAKNKGKPFPECLKEAWKKSWRPGFFVARVMAEKSPR